MLKIYRCSAFATIPTFATKESACFDIYACLRHAGEIKIYSTQERIQFLNEEIESITLQPGERVAVPTKLIFDIPTGYSIRLHPRSGLALKQGIGFTNSEGIIDSDYVDEVKAIISNFGSLPYTIKHGDRICQGELVKSLDYTIEERYNIPAIKTDRVGGFGSTGE
jgi:dUTP pyrophosphatase